MDVLRTPEERFALLPFFPFAPCYAEDLPGFEGMRLHYVDEGGQEAAARAPSAAGTFLCLHGEPTWAYLYRKMIPVFRDAGARVVAPDFFGFGRSDKPATDDDYTFAFHRNSLLRLVERLDLRDITLVCQDWGGILGLTLPMEMPDRFSRILVMNTGLPTGAAIGPGFAAWKSFAGSVRDIPVAGLVALSSPGALNPLDAVAYDAPFPDVRYKAGVRRFPQLVPVEPGMEGIEECRRARAWLASEWSGQSFMAIGLRDPILGKPAMEDLRTTLRGCPAPLEIPEAGHFVQEWGEPVAKAALEAFGLSG